MKPGWKWGIMWCCILIPLLAVLAFVCMGMFNVFHAHEHCIKQAGLGFRTYAIDHDGRLPYDTDGFGNALLLLVKGGYLGDTDGVYSLGPITGPGDKGDVFRKALRTGERIPEEQCSRIYIQGLSETNDPQIAVLFDKRSSPGGDHFHRPWGPRLRELCLLDGSIQTIPDQRWPEFTSNQVELLVQAGITRQAAKKYYQMR
jgi:hypothetical protein